MKCVAIMRLDPTLGHGNDVSERRITFRRRRALAALTLSLCIYTFVVAWAVLMSESGFSDAACLALIHVGSAAGLFTFWRMGRWGRARFDGFGAALLLLAVALRLQALVDVAVFGTRVEQMYPYPGVPIPSNEFLLFMKAETITVVGLLLAACAWRLRVGLRVEAHSFLLNVRSVPPRVPLIIYLSALSVDFAIRVLGASFGAFAVFSTTLFMFGVASIYFLASRRASRSGRIAAALALALPMTILALNKGMKTEIFLPMIPAAVFLWTGYRSALLRVLFVAVAALVLTISQLYVFHVRRVAWQTEGIVQISPVTLVKSFVAELPAIDMRDALDSTSSRINMTVAHAVTVSLADHNGFEPDNVFGAIPATFVPRFLWPSKPVQQPGAMQTARMLGDNTPVSEIRSATATGFAAELYLGGWWIGVVLGMWAYGFLLASAQRWALRSAPGFGHLAFCFLALYWALRFDENHVVYSYTAIVFVVAFLWILHNARSALLVRPPIGIRLRYLRDEMQ